MGKFLGTRAHVQAQIRRGSTSKVTQAGLRCRRSVALAFHRDAKPETSSYVGNAATQRVHRIRMTFLLLTLAQVTVDNAVNSLRKLAVCSTTGKFLHCCLHTHVENFVREFDRGSRVLASFLVGVSCPRLAIAACVLARVVAVSGERIAALFQGTPQRFEALLAAAAALPHARAEQLPFKPLGLGGGLCMRSLASLKTHCLQRLRSKVLWQNFCLTDSTSAGSKWLQRLSVVGRLLAVVSYHCQREFLLKSRNADKGLLT